MNESENNKPENDTGIEPTLEENSIREEQDGMSCFNYMKDHPGFLGACVSAFVAVAAFLFNATLYRKIGGYLEYWGFRAENVDIVYNNQIYVLVVVLVFCLASLWISWFLGKTFYVYQQYADIRYYLALAVRRLCIKWFMLNLSVWWLGIRIRFGKWLCRKENKLYTLANENADMEKNIKKVSENFPVLGKNLLISWLRNLLRMLPSLLIANLMMISVLFLFSTFENSAKLTDAIFASVLVTLTYDFVMFFMVKLEFSQRIERKNTKRRIKEKPEQAYELIHQLAEKISDRYPVESIAKHKFVALFTNRRLAIAILAMVFSLLYVFFSVPANIDDITTDMSEFAVVNIDEQEYAIIYTSGNKYYLNMAEVNSKQGTIMIDTSKQRIIVSDDISYEVTEYRTVLIKTTDGGWHG